MRHRLLLGLAVAAVGGAAVACEAGPSEAAPAPPAAPVIRLCGPRAPGARGAGRTVVRVVEGRLRSLGLRATVLASGRGCYEARLRERAPHLRRLAGILAQRGQFVQAVAVPNASASLAPGTRVRFVGGRGGAERGLPAVRPVFTWRGVVRASVGLSKGLPPTADLLTFSLKARARRAWCGFTGRHIGKRSPAVLDHLVVEDAILGTRLCSGVLGPLPAGGAARLSRFGALALRAYLRFGPLPFRWRSVTITRPRS